MEVNKNIADYIAYAAAVNLVLSAYENGKITFEELETEVNKLYDDLMNKG